MEFEDALFSWVSTQATLTALIGTPPAAVRFFKLRIPQGGKSPAIVQQRSGADRQRLACRIDGAVKISLQLDFYAREADTVAELAKAFRQALRPDVANFPLEMGTGDSPAVSVKVKDAMLENEFDGEDEEPGLVRRTQFWSFWIREP